jgi:hypothetical protein
LNEAILFNLILLAMLDHSRLPYIIYQILIGAMQLLNSHFIARIPAPALLSTAGFSHSGGPD